MKMVTGATGFLGTHVLYELVSKGGPVKALYRDEKKIALVRKMFGYYSSDVPALWDKIEWIAGDILDYYSMMEHFKAVTEIYHTAGLFSFIRKDEEKLNRTNIQGTANVVNACLELGINKLCHVSSISALGESDGDELIDENILRNPGISASAYAISKFNGEMEVWRGIHEGLQAVIINPSIIIGPGMWLGPAGHLFENLRKGLRYYPEGSNGYVDVRDVAMIMVKLLEGNIFGERFIINSENMTYRDLLRNIASALNQSEPDRPITHALSRTIAIAEKIRSLFTGLPPRVTIKTLDIANEKLAYSNDKIRNKLKINFIPIQESVKYSISKYLAETNTESQIH